MELILIILLVLLLFGGGFGYYRGWGGYPAGSYPGYPAVGGFIVLILIIILISYLIGPLHRPL